VEYVDAAAGGVFDDPCGAGPVYGVVDGRVVVEEPEADGACEAGVWRVL
jgi:hypothetical protein